MDQLKTIFRALGTPTEEEWPVRLFLFLFFSRKFSFSTFSRALPKKTYSNYHLETFFLFLVPSFFRSFLSDV
jgi:hypothetical protein